MDNEIKFEFVERAKQLPNFGADGSNTGRLPERSTKASAGYDFFNIEEVTLAPSEMKYVKTGVKAKFPEDHMLLLLNRSSNPKKKGLVLINGVGLVDADYYNNEDNEGEIAFAFMNTKSEPVTLSVGEKLGQGVFAKFSTVTEETAVENTRSGGFGSTEG